VLPAIVPGDQPPEVAGPIIGELGVCHFADLTGLAMDILVRQLENACVVTPQGRVDQATADGLRLGLEPHLAACTENAPALILDLSGVPYISSVGLRVLMLAGRQVTAQKGRLALAALQPVVREVFEISRFNMVFSLHESVDAAAAALTA
jgi:anti-sigma B factor antagonist